MKSWKSLQVVLFMIQHYFFITFTLIDWFIGASNLKRPAAKRGEQAEAQSSELNKRRRNTIMKSNSLTFT